MSDTVADVMGHSLQEVVHVLHMKAIDFYILVFFSISESCLQCFDAVGWAAGRASGL